MKKYISLVVFAVALLLIGAPNIDAAIENSIKANMSCPSVVATNSSLTCSVYVTASGSDGIVEKTEIEMASPIIQAQVNIPKGTVIKSGSKMKVGTVTAKTNNQSEAGMIRVGLTVRFDGGEPVYRYPSASKTINVVKPSNKLTSIKIDGATVPGFSSNKTSYSVTTTKKSINLTASKASSSATVTGTGQKNLTCGNNPFTIAVISSSGSTKNYNVNINRKCETPKKEVFLDGITVSSGKLSPEFKKDTYSYTLKLDSKEDKITIKGVKVSSSDKLTGEVTDKKLEYGKTVVTLTVSNNSGNKKDYKITITREDKRDDNSLLASLSLSSGNIEFDKNVFEYETKILFDVKDLEILAVPEKESSEVKITGNKNLKVGDNTVIITVKSEKGKVKTYKIKVTRLEEGMTLGDNPNIKSIIVKGYELPFKYDRQDYNLVIDKEDMLDIRIIMDDPTATYEIIGNQNLEDGSIIKIITKSSDGSTKTYTIEVVKSNYSPYYIILIALAVLVIAVPLYVYFKQVKGKKEELDVNGYKKGKVYEEKDYSRKQIKNTKNVIGVTDKPQKITKNEPKQANNKPKKQNQKKTPQQQTKVDVQAPNAEIDFDEGLQDYIPNESANKCVACGRELLGNPDVCPYCKTKLK